MEYTATSHAMVAKQNVTSMEGNHRWLQRRADWMNYKEEEKHEQNKV